MKKIFLIGILFAGILLAGCTQPATTGNIAAGQQQNNAQETKTISVPLADLGSEAKFFEYKSAGTAIRFFAVKAGDGSIKTAFDACDVCYSSHKGFRQEGSYMVCNNCGNKYPISGLGTENRNPGGCWPSFLESRISGENLLIEKTELEKGVYLFS